MMLLTVNDVFNRELYEGIDKLTEKITTRYLLWYVYC